MALCVAASGFSTAGGVVGPPPKKRAAEETPKTRSKPRPAEEEAVSTPIGEWLSDPADDQRYEARLRSLLGAVEALEDGAHSRAEGR